MIFHSTNNKSLKASLKEAVLRGLAPDNGLFMPSNIPLLRNEFFAQAKNLSFQEIALEVIQKLFTDDLSHEEIKELVQHTITFDAPLVEIEKNIFALELFHGPTLAFKDFGARFCSKLISILTNEQSSKLKILVATSGDTGSAVANGFLGISGIEVIILYPKGKVSEIQEKQFVTLGQNITAVQIDGTFDECQRLVKEAFLDSELNEKICLTSANSINVARWIPQCLYYFYSWSRLKKTNKCVYSVPSGNFGNLAAGVLAYRMGLPIDLFIAATNINKIVPDYLLSGKFQPQKSIPTISNSMDVGSPSNFPRLISLYNNDEESLRSHIKGFYISDCDTQNIMREVYNKFNYILDPHGAVAYAGLKSFLQQQSEYTGVFLETAHPAKFKNTVDETLEIKLTIPEKLAKFIARKSEITVMQNNYGSFKDFLISH